jgi:VWFA-related protein
MSRLALALALAAVPTAFPSAPETETEVPVFGAGTSLVMVPVFVADGDGHAMRGLQPEDFELYHDKERVDIVSFRYIDTTSPEEQEEIREAPAARRRFLLFFDMSFTNLEGLQRARRAARQMILHDLAPSDLAAVAVFDADRGVRLVANFTEDKALLVHAINTLGIPNLARLSDPLALSGFEVTDRAGFGSDNLGNVFGDAHADTVLGVYLRRLKAADESFYRSQVTNLLLSMEDLGQALRGVEGRKQVVFFSAGFDSGVLIGATGVDMRRDSEALVTGRLWDVQTEGRYGDTGLRQMFQSATRSLSRSDSVVHTIDVTGLGSDDSLQRTYTANDPARQVRGRDSLHLLARETGGRLFKDTNDLGEVMEELVAMTSRYYILGYQLPELEGPGHFHRLEVKVRRKGAQLSHRAGFSERQPLATQPFLQRTFEAAQLVMTGVGQNDLEFSALCLPFPAPGDRQTLGLVVQVPREALRWEGPGPTAVEVFSYVVRPDGAVVDRLTRRARVDLAEADPLGATRGLALFGTFSVLPGRYTIRIMVEARQEETAGIQFLDVTVPAYDPNAGFLLPPVVMDDPEAWLGLDLGSGGAGRSDFPFVVGGEPFLPRATSRLERGVPERLALISYEPERPGDPAAGVEIRSSLTDAQGRLVPAGYLRITRVDRGPDGRRTYVLRYTPDELAAGDYTLRIGLGEAGRQIESYGLVRMGGEDTPTPP